MKALTSRFARGDRVVIDRDKSLVATVTAHLFRADYQTVEISYVHNGDVKTAWIEEWRCEAET